MNNKLIIFEEYLIPMDKILYVEPVEHYPSSNQSYVTIHFVDGEKHISHAYDNQPEAMAAYDDLKRQMTKS